MDLLHLEKLSQLDGPPGYEKEVSAYMHQIMSQYCDKVDRDNVGNVIGFIKGNQDFKLMLSAHMDEVGFIIHDILPGGFLKFECIGSFDIRLLPGMEVKVLGKEKVRGIIGVNPPHVQTDKDKTKIYPLEGLSIDTGLEEDELKEAGISIGSFATPGGAFSIAGNRIMGKAFDDRAGCSLLLEMAKKFGKNRANPDLYIVATCQEETGSLGALLAAGQIKPHISLALEGTVAADIDGVPTHKIPTFLNKGPAITLIDGGMIAHQGLAHYIKGIAQEKSIKHQFRRPRRIGGTEAREIQKATGCPATVISVPCRYIHSACSIMDKRDIQGASDLVEAFVKELSLEKLENIRFS